MKGSYLWKNEKNENTQQQCVELTIHTKSFGKVRHNFYNFQRFFKVSNEFVGKKNLHNNSKASAKTNFKILSRCQLSWKEKKKYLLFDDSAIVCFDKVFVVLFFIFRVFCLTDIVSLQNLSTTPQMIVEFLFVFFAYLFCC